jgi:phenylpropionate dioxygenase-like ring-hydroxylating dioxygenase large terminal subunit
VRNAWYVACLSRELGKAPLKRKLHGDPLVVFRTASGRAAALQDRCPHRNVPLSYGCVKGETLQCGYHGWKFDERGRVEEIPGYVGDEVDKPGRRAPFHAVREQQGLVWVWATPDVEPDVDPYHFEYADRPGYLTVRHVVRANASIHAVAENALDVPHTAYLHGGLFRNPDARNEIRAVVRREHDRVEAEYIGEPRPTGLIGRLISPSGGVVTHFDRFILPSIVQVEYRLGDENHLMNSAALTPEDDYETALYAVVALRTRFPPVLARPVIQPIALRIFGQDAEVLSLQTKTLERFGEEKYASTDLDLLGPQILKLLQRAEKGEIDPASKPWTREVGMRV